jgi:hypothetical protein
MYQKELKQILNTKNNDVHNLVKFLDGTIHWSKWFLSKKTDKELQELSNDMFNNLKKKD